MDRRDSSVTAPSRVLSREAVSARDVLLGGVFDVVVVAVAWYCCSCC